jgi:SNF2 family DNA or RNA helicase
MLADDRIPSLPRFPCRGLGKTIQATSIIAAVTHEAREAYSTRGGPPPRPSLIICPATLVAHWPCEIGKYVDEEVCAPSVQEACA